MRESLVGPVSLRLSALCLLVLVAVPGARGAGPSAPSRVERAIARLGESSGGTLGVSAVHVETGRRIAFNADERFPMPSTYKVPIALAVLRLVDAGALRLDQTVTLGVHDFRLGASATADFAHGSPITLTLGRLLE